MRRLICKILNHRWHLIKVYRDHRIYACGRCGATQIGDIS